MKKFVSVVLLIYTVLHVVVVLRVVSIEANDSNNPSEDQAEEYDWSYHFLKLDTLLRRDPPRISLSCVLFSDLGCDAECFAVTSAYGLLGTGVCDKDHTCDCNFAMNTTLEGIWNQKFGAIENVHILKKIQADFKLLKKVNRIFLYPFQTGQQIKQNLDQEFPGHDFDQLAVSDNIPASKMFPIDGTTNQDVIGRHINEKLSQAVELSNQKLSDIEYESALKKILNDVNLEANFLRDLLREIRRIDNDSLTSILLEYPRHQNEPADNTKDTSHVDLIADKMIHTLVKKTTPTVAGKWVKWLGNKFNCFIFKSCTSVKSDFGEDQDDSMEDPNQYLLPAKAYKKIKREIGSFRATLKGDRYKVRYQRGDKGYRNLNWIKRSIRVSILKTERGNINQNWNFRSVRINISRTSDGHIGQWWDFGEYSYQYQYDKKNDKDGTSYEKWSNRLAKQELLDRYKGYIDKWCLHNDVFVGTNDCVIYKN